MNKLLKKFLYCEQVLNNYSLYNDNRYIFKMNLSNEYLPESQKFFKLPYFVIPIDRENNEFSQKYKDFLDVNFFINKKGKNFYPFFIHPVTEDIFKNWIDDKYIFINSDESEFIATPTSSYRSLIIQNINTKNYFIAKVSIFDNVANGSRHIDWKSASGQYSSSNITSKAISKIQNFELFEDIGFFTISGNVSFNFSNKFKIVFGSNKIDTFGIVIRKIPDILLNDFVENKNVLSVASFTSLLRKQNSFLLESYKNSKFSSFFDYLDNYIFIPLFNIFYKLFYEYGITLEPHCQNVLIELDDLYVPTSNFFYRDFDLTSFDRARFPFVFTEFWLKQICDRNDLTSLMWNLSMREGIGAGFFNHFIGNLIIPCVLSAVESKLIDRNSGEQYIHKKFNYIKIKLKEVIPLMDEEFYLNGQEWNFNKGILSKISKSEIPMNLNKIDGYINLDDYSRYIVCHTTNKNIIYYKVSENIIVSFVDDVMYEIYIKY